MFKTGREKMKLIKNISYTATARYSFNASSPWTYSRFVDTRILAIKKSPFYLILECIKIPLIVFDFYLFAVFLSSLKSGDIFIELLVVILVIVFAQRAARYYIVGQMSMVDIDKLNQSIDNKLESLENPTPRRKIIAFLITVVVIIGAFIFFRSLG